MIEDKKKLGGKGLKVSLSKEQVQNSHRINEIVLTTNNTKTVNNGKVDSNNVTQIEQGVVTAFAIYSTTTSVEVLVMIEKLIVIMKDKINKTTIVDDKKVIIPKSIV